MALNTLDRRYSPELHPQPLKQVSLSNSEVKGQTENQVLWSLT